MSITKFNRCLVLAIVLVAGPAAVVQTELANGKVKLFIPYQEYSQEENQRILKLYEWLRVADVSNGMDVVGVAVIGTVSPNCTSKRLPKLSRTFFSPDPC